MSEKDPIQARGKRWARSAKHHPISAVIHTDGWFGGFNWNGVAKTVFLMRGVRWKLTPKNTFPRKIRVEQAQLEKQRGKR